MAGHFGGPSEWASTAALNALLRYAPQREALKGLIGAAEEQFRSSVRAGRSEGAQGVQAAEAARAPTQQIYSQAATEGQRGRSLAAPVLAALGASSPFAAAAANESAAGEERLAGSRAHALSDLQAQQVAATEVPAATRSTATATLLRELGKLQQRGFALEGAEGADKAAEAAKLRAEANRLGVTERDNERTTGTSRANAEEGNRTKREAAAGKGAAGGVKPLTTAQQNAGKATLDQIRHYAGELGGGSAPRGEVVQLLTEGQPQSSHPRPTGRKDSSGKEIIEHVPVPKIPAFKLTPLMSAALDELELGHVQPTHVKALEREGYDPRRLGLKLPARSTRGKVEQGVGDVGRHVQHALAGL